MHIYEYNCLCPRCDIRVYILTLAKNSKILPTKDDMVICDFSAMLRYVIRHHLLRKKEESNNALDFIRYIFKDVKHCYYVDGIFWMEF